MSKPVILTGLRANNDLHIGNYFGALLPLIDMAKTHANEYEVNLFVPDLHSFTTPIDHTKLYVQIMHNLKLFAAAGLPLDSDSIHIYRQSYVPAHSELTWILDCFTSVGVLQRMTQYKDKSASLMMEAGSGNDIAFPIGQGEDAWKKKFDEPLMDRMEKAVTTGLFNYPVLMAADMLLYGASYVPVGDDQSQHLEFTRDLAGRMNNRFGELFVIPKPVKEQHEFFGKDQGLRIRDLVDPTKKMSKSDNSEKGIIFLGDDPETAAKKIMSATTDSMEKVGVDPDFEKRPGVANLVQLLRLMQPDTNEPVSDMTYKEFKEHVASAVSKFLGDFQSKFATVDEGALQAKLEKDEAAMNVIANATLLKVQKAVGLRA